MVIYAGICKGALGRENHGAWGIQIPLHSTEILVSTFHRKSQIMNVRYGWVLALLLHFGGRELPNEVFCLFSSMRCIFMLLKKYIVWALRQWGQFICFPLSLQPCLWSWGSTLGPQLLPAFQLIRFIVRSCVRIWAKSFPKPPPSAQMCKTPVKTLCWVSPVCKPPMEARFLVTLWQGLMSATPSHLLFSLRPPISTAWSPRPRPGCIPQRARLAPAQHLQQQLPPPCHPFHIQHLTMVRRFKHFLNYGVVNTSLKTGQRYTIKGKMYKLCGVVSICSSTWNYTRNRRLLSEKSILLSFLWLC